MQPTWIVCQVKRDFVNNDLDSILFAKLLTGVVCSLPFHVNTAERFNLDMIHSVTGSKLDFAAASQILSNNVQVPTVESSRDGVPIHVAIRSMQYAFRFRLCL